MKDVASSSDRESRSLRNVEAFLHRQDGQETKAVVVNISARGCKLSTGELLAVDELVRLEVPRLGSVVAAIRWVSRGSAGAEFIPHSEMWEDRPAA
jgi:hypothetical protein